VALFKLTAPNKSRFLLVGNGIQVEGHDHVAAPSADLFFLQNPVWNGIELSEWFVGVPNQIVKCHHSRKRGFAGPNSRFRNFLFQL
jgi:hypothetical protein